MRRKLHLTNFMSIITTIFFCIVLLTAQVLAATKSQDGLDVTLFTDKDEYDKTETVIVTLNVTNTNDVAVNNVRLETLIPEGYMISKDEVSTKTIDTLEPGETVSLIVQYLSEEGDKDVIPPEGGTISKPGENKHGETSSSAEPEEKNDKANTESGQSAKKNTSGNSSSKSTNVRTNKNKSADTGDDNNVLLMVILFLLGFVGVIATLFVKKKKGAKFILFFALGLPITLILYDNVMASVIKSIDISEEITVQGKVLEVKGVVNYDDLNNDSSEIGKEAFYRENSDIKKIINVTDSIDTLTEAEANKILKERGFSDFPIIYEFSISGEFVDETEAVDNNNKHPVYQTHYVSDSDMLWTIDIINGSIFANPVTYNLEETKYDAQLIISETDELTSYDDESNRYYVTVPKESAVIVKTVERIDAETLNQLTVEEIGNL